MNEHGCGILTADQVSRGSCDHRLRALRRLVSFAQKASPWHARRLAGLDPARLTKKEFVERVPPMTKQDLIESFDEIVTDRLLSLQRCRTHLGSARHLDGKYVVTQSGSSSATPTIVVLTPDELGRQHAAFARLIENWTAQTPGMPRPAAHTIITACAPVFRSLHIAAAFDGFNTIALPIGSPWPELMLSLNRIRPDVLSTYPSLLPRLAASVEDSSLTAAPKLVLCGAEPLLEEHRAVAKAWTCSTIINLWGATETGLLAMGSGFRSGMQLLDDEALIEPVDQAGKAVANRQLSDKVYVTPLFRRTLPLLRYELTDRLRILPRQPESAPTHRWIADIKGRLEDDFAYENAFCARVPADLFREAVGAYREVLEYQVRQTARGVCVLLTAQRPFNSAGLSRTLWCKLESLLGFPPELSVKQVDAIERSGAAQKLRRFIPLDFLSNGRD